MRILLFAGAGTTAELGVPAMRPMVLGLRDHCRERRIAPQLVDKLEEFLKDEKYDMETLIEQLDHMTAATGAYAKWGGGATALAGVGLLRQEAEWFVNHVCERVDAQRAEKLWGPTLDSFSGHSVVVVTTNYDRAVEIAAGRRNRAAYDGFADFGEDEWARWQGFPPRSDFILLKVHGSTDWYHSADGDAVWKLRHPMPLFGRVTMQVEAPTPLRLKSAAILPSREKKMNLHPYPDLAYEFRRAVDETEFSLFIGTSLRDPDMRALFRRAAERGPAFLIGRRAVLPADCGGIVIRQTSSRFLAATLPAAISTGDPITYLKTAAGQSSADKGILDDILLALDPKQSAHIRCASIESLASMQVSLPAATLQPLLCDADSSVRTYALALIQSSVDKKALLDFAKSSAPPSDDPVYSQELAILERILEIEQS